jgi:hypothetical protein
LLILIPVAALILTVFGWGSLVVPENLVRFLELGLLVAALGCAYPLRQVLSRAQPLGWPHKIVVFTLVLALWFFSLLPLLMIANVKLDSSAPKKIERAILDTEERGTNVCKVKVSNWDESGTEEFHWLWLDCPHPHTFVAGTSKVSYNYHRGGLRFAWVSELKAVK